MTHNRFFLLFALSITLFTSCSHRGNKEAPTVGFIEAFEDATISDAKKGFIDALEQQGFSEDKGTLNFLYRNAQGDAGTMNQIVSFMQSQAPDCLGTSTTLSTLAAVQRIKEIPIFMCVTAMPDILGLTGADQKATKNLFGVGEDLNYIDTSFYIIKEMVKPKYTKRLRIGMIYNQAEPQSVDAFNRLKALAAQSGVDMVALPLNNSADAQLVVRALLAKQIDAFFANPDNTVFAAFETIVNNCNTQRVPVFTSEVGLVKRGAVAAYGADIYQWGYQAGLQAAAFLKDKKDTTKLKLEKVKVRKRVYNAKVAKDFGFVFSEAYESL